MAYKSHLKNGFYFDLDQGFIFAEQILLGQNEAYRWPADGKTG